MKRALQAAGGRRAVADTGALRASLPRRIRRPWGATRREWLPAAAGLLVVGLLLAALRIEILRVRYDLAEALQSETQLLRENRELTVEVRRLRDPARLAALAREWGLARPERVIELGAASASGRATP